MTSRDEFSRRGYLVDTVCGELQEQVALVCASWKEAQALHLTAPTGALESLAAMSVALEAIVPVQVRELTKNVRDLMDALDADLPQSAEPD